MFFRPSATVCVGGGDETLRELDMLAERGALSPARPFYVFPFERSWRTHPDAGTARTRAAEEEVEQSALVGDTRCIVLKNLV